MRQERQGRARQSGILGSCRLTGDFDIGRPGFGLTLAILGKAGVKRGDDLRTVSNRRCDALDRARANVSHREDAPAAGLEREAPGGGIFARADKSPGIHLQTRLPQPIGIRLGADEGK